MKQLYKDKIREVELELSRVKKCIDGFNRRKKPLKHIKDINVYQNYALIFAYGCVEDILKNIVADYYSKSRMSEKCKNFANTLCGDRKPLTCNKESLNKFFSKECSPMWIGEIKLRENSNCTDRKTHLYTYNEMYFGLNFITTHRNSFAHGNGQYTGTIQNIDDQFKRCKAYLYEIDNIINSSNLKG